MGPQEQRDSRKGWQNRKATCCTLLKRITKFKMRKFRIRDQSIIDPELRVASIGSYCTMSESP